MTPSLVFGNANTTFSYETQTVYVLKGSFFDIYKKYHVPHPAAKYKLNKKF